MYRGIEILFYQLLREQDRVFKVVALPRDESDDDVAAERELSLVAGLPVPDYLVGVDMLPGVDERTLVDDRPLVRTAELRHMIFVLPSVVRPDDYQVGVDIGDGAGSARYDAGAGVLGDTVFNARSHDRRIREDEGDRLALHVGTHQRAVRVVVLEEGNERRRNGDDLLRRYVEVVELLRVYLYSVVMVTDIDAACRGREDVALVIHRQVGAPDIVFVLVVRREIDDLLRDLAVHHLAARADKEAVVVDTCEGGERGDEPDVRAFRRFDRADASVMRMVDVARLKSRALAREAAGAEGGKTASVRQLRKRVCLVHKLRKLSRTEKLTQRRRYRTDVDEILRHRRGKIRRRRHTLARDALHAQKPDADLVLKQLADRAHAAVAEMVDVVHVLAAVAKADQPLDYRHDIGYRKQPFRIGKFELQAAIYFVASDTAEIISSGIEEYAGDIFTGVLHTRRFVGAQLAEKLKHRRVRRVGVVALYRHGEGGIDIPYPYLRAPVVPEDLHVLLCQARVLADLHGAGAVVRNDILREKHSADIVVNEILLDLFAVKERDYLVRTLDAESSQHHRDGNLLAVVYLYGENVPRGEVKLDPRSAVRDQLRHKGLLSRNAEVRTVIDAGRAGQLVYNDTFRAVDDKGSPLRHRGEVTKINFFFLDLAGLLVYQADRRTQRSRPRKVPAASLIQTDRNRIDIISYKFQSEGSVVALDRENLIEKLLQPL